MTTARFDDLRPRRRRSFTLAGPERTLVATRLSEVEPVVAAAAKEVAAGRWVAGFVAYEAAPALDPSLAVLPTVGTVFEDLPLAWFAVFAGRGPSPAERAGGYAVGEWVPTMSADRHGRAVGSVRRHVRNGDTYQVNLTFRLEAPFRGDPAGLYRDLSRSQSCGYGAFLDAGRWAVASASPELFFEWRHGLLTCRPMKGTMPRGVDLAADEDRRGRLVSSEKDRAENLMIVDMVRNDLGRVARVGSVSVPRLFEAEKYDTVWQLTSTVTAEPASGTALAEVFAALFPSASITGTPKVATMEIIRRLESGPRGVYCGTIGFGGPGPGGPEWAFNVGIRTVVIDRATATAHYGTGGGVTYDSTPAGEYEEAVLKARVLARRSADFELLETLRWSALDGFHRTDRHLRRLADASSYFDVPLDQAEVRAALDSAVRGRGGVQRVRLVVDRTGWVGVKVAPLDPPRRVRLAIDDRPVDPDDPFLRHKTTNRGVYEEAAARHPEADDVALVNGRGEVTETTIANLAVCLDGRWCTPPLASGCLPGVERAALLEEGELVERVVTVDDLAGATHVARLNALRGWEPVDLAV